MDVLKRLFQSRKFVTALTDAVAMLLVIVLGPKLGMTEEKAHEFANLLFWLGTALIAGTAVEDAAQKAGSKGGKTGGKK